ncbi:uncharacterized protein LOC112351695 [Selaginella moellendorffii]|uniref:uncharacterized protein LOC112351695 n=1 Tax=Selaginella moellendorffii TaxID=88036 RepID=UPI000D1C7EFE|nr:uncharacterized protein LOC112351695 [Selaginella moellendorffii]|eukprot:XP_024545806.1 uncharacterized protein LOC112351695 [Selaginella moellendorffii]
MMRALFGKIRGRLSRAGKISGSCSEHEPPVACTGMSAWSKQSTDRQRLEEGSNPAVAVAIDAAKGLFGVFMPEVARGHSFCRDSIANQLGSSVRNRDGLAKAARRCSRCRLRGLAHSAVDGRAVQSFRGTFRALSGGSYRFCRLPQELIFFALETLGYVPRLCTHGSPIQGYI